MLVFLVLVLRWCCGTNRAYSWDSGCISACQKQNSVCRPDGSAEVLQQSPCTGGGDKAGPVSGRTAMQGSGSRAAVQAASGQSGA